MTLFPDFWIINFYAENGESALHKIHPLVKIVAFLTLAVLSVIVNNLLTLTLLFLLALLASLSTRVPSRTLLSWLFIPLLFAFSISVLLPFTVPGAPLYTLSFQNMNIVMSREGIRQGVLIVLKVLTAALAVFAIVVTTPHFELLYYVQKILPRTLSTMIFLTFRYVFLVIDEMKRMSTAIGARGGSLLKTFTENVKLFGNILGTFLIRTIDRAGRIYTAMEVRGFDGTFRILAPRRKITLCDIFFLLGMVALMLLFMLVTGSMEVMM